MKAVKLILVLVITFVGTNEMTAVDAVSSEGTGLLEEALKYSVEISKQGLKRLSEQIFGSGRAARSTDVAIFNRCGYKFKCVSSTSDYGGYTSSLLPEYELLSKECTLFGTESTSLFRRAGCTTKYESDDGTFFELRVDNPYSGKNTVSRSSSANLILVNVVGTGSHNQVRLIVEDKNSNVFSASESSTQTSTSSTTRKENIINPIDTPPSDIDDTSTDINIRLFQLK